MIEPYYKNELVTLYHGDCLEILPQIEERIDACITDPPYAVTCCKWDEIIPFNKMWRELYRAVKTDGAICIFGCEPFSSVLRMSNIEDFKYDMYWHKTTPTGFLFSAKQPLRDIETISVFYREQCTYNPQMRKGFKPYKAKRGDNISLYRPTKSVWTVSDGERFPTQTLEFAKEGKKLHTSQKPVLLLNYLVNTFTNENETVLDFTCGSGSTGVSCMKTNRRCIMIEKEEKYCEIAKSRLIEEEDSMGLFNWNK